MDLSLSGFKIEIMGSLKHKANDRFWLHLPLVAFGIHDLASIDLRAEVKWVDHDHSRIGGVFVDLDPNSKEIIERILLSISKKSNQKL